MDESVEVFSRTQHIVVGAQDKVEVLSRMQHIIVGQKEGMFTPVKVLSRPQTIVVKQNVGVTVTNAGPPGPPGFPGAPGPPGVAIGRRWYGDGPPGTIVGSAPNDEYLDRLTGTLYTLQ